jgi:hypothetical protein
MLLHFWVKAFWNTQTFCSLYQILPHYTLWLFHVDIILLTDSVCYEIIQFQCTLGRDKIVIPCNKKKMVVIFHHKKS